MTSPTPNSPFGPFNDWSVAFSDKYSGWQVRKQSSQNLLALKEVNLHNPAFGKDKKSRDNNVEKIISELTIIKEQAQIELLKVQPMISQTRPVRICAFHALCCSSYLDDTPKRC